MRDRFRPAGVRVFRVLGLVVTLLTPVMLGASTETWAQPRTETSAEPEQPVSSGRNCRFEIPGDTTVAREMIRLLLSGGLAPGVESNRCLKPERFLKLRTPKVSPSEELPRDRLIPYDSEDRVQLLEVKSTPESSPAEQRVRFALLKKNGRRIEDEFSLLLYRNPRLQLMMGCAELLDSSKYRYYPRSQSRCP